jgi:hypothetical protein
LTLCRATSLMDGQPSSNEEKPMRGGCVEARQPRPIGQTSKGKTSRETRHVATG